MEKWVIYCNCQCKCDLFSAIIPYMQNFWQRWRRKFFRVSVSTCDDEPSEQRQLDYDTSVSTREQRERILAALQIGDKSSSDLSRETRLDRQTVVRRLRDLVADGQVATVGQGKSVLYTVDENVLACRR